MATIGKILLVEDDPLDMEMTIETLKEIPLANEIIWLETGQQLVDYLYQHPKEIIALIILDLNMPQLSGIQALEQIRKEPAFDAYPVVVLTSSNREPDIKKCYELGVNAFVTKPVAQDEFQEAIRTLGLFWGILNELP